MEVKFKHKSSQFSQNNIGGAICLMTKNGVQAKKFHRTGKRLAQIIRILMDPDDELYYFRSINDDSGIIKRRSRIKHLLILKEG